MNVKSYTLSVPIKKQLGIIIKTMRIKYFNEYKSTDLIDVNPYTKDNFCDNNKICHYHTLTKLETDYIRDDSVYHELLKKLNLAFQVKDIEHEANMDTLHKLVQKLVNGIEYLDEDLVDAIQKELETLSYPKDCIASFYIDLLKFSFYTMIKLENNEKDLKEIEDYLPIYQDIYQPLAYQACAYGNLLAGHYEKALVYAKKANELYQNYHVSIGFKYIPLVDIYIFNNNYYEAILLCNKLEDYYIQANNQNRLLLIYMYLVDYYLLINSKEFAKKYYDEAMSLAGDNATYADSMVMMQYNYGYYHLKMYQYEDALKSFIEAFHYSQTNIFNLFLINRIIICLTYLKKPEEDILAYISKGKKYFQYATEIEQLIFNYFVYKNDHRNHVDYAKRLIIPKLKLQHKFKIILLFFYEDIAEVIN